MEPNFQNSLVWQILFLKCFIKKERVEAFLNFFSLVAIDSFSLGFFISVSSNNSGFQRPT